MLNGIVRDMGQKGRHPDAIRNDALAEMGNIAAAHASAALSKVVGEDILIDISESRVVPVEKFPSSLGENGERVSAVYMNIHGRDRCIVLMVLPYDQAMWIADMFLKNYNVQRTSGDGLETSALCEIGNICICAYLNAVSKFLDMSLIPSPPALALDMLAAILEVPASLVGEVSEHVLVVQTGFVHPEVRGSGYIVFIPDQESRERILARFSVDNL